MKVLILTDGKAGHENQSKAFARALGCEFDLIEVQFKSKLCKAFSYLLDRVGLRRVELLKGLEKIDHDGVSYSAVIGTGSGTFYAAKSLAKQLGVRCGVVLYPRGYHLRSFDCVLAPSFDRPAKQANVIEIPANLVAADEAFYAKGIEDFKVHYGKCSNGGAFECSNAVAVIVGGPNKCSTMTPEWMKAQLDAIFDSSARSPGQPNLQYWVTTSRRTPPEVEAVVDSYPWNYKLLYSRDHFNPIPAFVKLAKKLYVTAESTGMLSEACTFGSAEVVALDNLKAGPHKFRRFVDNLKSNGYVNGARKVDLSGEFAAARRLMGI